MLIINLSEINSEIDKLNNLIEEYEEIQLNIFNQLKDSSINWTDDKSLMFYEKINDDKKESDFFLIYIKEKLDLFDFIYNSYSHIGKKIICNLDQKNKILLLIENCLMEIKNILNEFDEIDIIADSYEENNILKQKKEMANVKYLLEKIKNNILQTYLKIENIEKEISKKIQSLENINIKEFDFTL